MAQLISVKHRGEEVDIKLFRDYGYEYDTGAHEIDWVFFDPSDGVNLTSDEEQNILDQLYEFLSDDTDPF